MTVTMDRSWKGTCLAQSSASRAEGAKECPAHDGKEHPRSGGNEGGGDLAGPGNFSRSQEPVPLICGCSLWK